MANNFKSYKNSNITTEAVVYTGPTATQSTVIGLSIANTSGSASYVSVKLNNVFMIKDAPLIGGSSLVVVGGDQKVVVEPGDTVSILSDSPVDSILSALEIS